MSARKVAIKPMGKPRRRVYVLLVFVLTAALVLDPLPGRVFFGTARGIRIDLSSPFRALASGVEAVPRVLAVGAREVASVVSSLFSRREASATTTASPSPDPASEIMSMRSADGSFFRNTDGSTTAVFEHHKHYQLSSGSWDDVNLNFHADGSDWVADRNSVIVRVSGKTLQLTERASGKGVSFALPAAPAVSGNHATFAGQQGLQFTYYATDAGVKLSAIVAKSLGAKTLTFAYTLVGGAAPLSVDANGNLLSDAFVIPRGIAVGADHAEYLAGVWRIVAQGQIAFDFDDTSFPAAAYPYELDPALTFNSAGAGDDDEILRTGSSYPPTGGYLTWTNAPQFEVGRDYKTLCGHGTGGPYCIVNGLVRWNTAALPDTATINSATLEFQLTYVGNPDNRVLTADWYCTGWPPVTSANYSATAQTGAISGWTIPSSTGVYYITSWASLSGISKTGYSCLRMHLSGGQPTGYNLLQLASADNTNGWIVPRLTVVYNNTAPTVPGVDSPSNPASPPAIPSVTPVLKVTPSTDPQGDPVSYQFQVAASTDTSFTSPVASSSWLPATVTWTVPPGSLKDGLSYIWRARAEDNWGATSGWTATSPQFNVRLTKLGSRGTWPMWSHGALGVNESNGNLVVSVPGPSYPSAAGSLGASLSYNSQDSTDHGFGAGWTLDAGDALSDPPQKIIDHSLLSGASKFDAAELVYSGGVSDYYTHVGTSDVYQAPPGDTSQLRKNRDVANPSTFTWSLVDADGTIYTFGDPAHPAASSEADLFSVETSDSSAGLSSLSYTFAGSPLRVTKVSDTASHVLTISYAGAGCATGLICVTGPDGVVTVFKGPAGTPTVAPLTTINDGTRDVATFSYASGLLSQIQNANDLDPTHASPGYNGSHAVAVGYDTATPKRVATITDGPITGQSPSSSTWTFAYVPGATTTSASANHGAGRPADGYATVTAPSAGASSKVFYDNLGRTLETDDVFGRSTLVQYNANDQVLWSEDQDGNPTDYVYDPLDATLTSVTGPDPDGVGPLTRPVTSNRYDETQIGTSSTPGAALQGLQGAYYANTSLAGRSAARQTDSTVDFNWGANAPAPLGGGATPDLYSARWTGDINAASEGDYTFSVSADDGSRLTVDGLMAIDAWTAHALRTDSSAVIHLLAGWHTIALDHYEAEGTDGQVHLLWSCVPGSTGSCSIAQQTIPTGSLRPAWGNQTSTIDPVGRIGFQHYADPAAGHADYSLVKVGSSNLITSYTYDTYGRMTQKVMPKGNASRTIDSSGNLTGTPDVTYATTWTFYAPTDTATIPTACGVGTAVIQAGLDKSMQHAGLAVESSVYDAAGRVVAATNGAGTTCNTFDAEGRLTSEIAPGESGPTTYTFDPAGAQRTATDPSGTLTSEYDEAGRMTRSVDSYGAESTFTYDSRGNRLGRTAAKGPLASNPNYLTTYAYNNGDQLTQLTDPALRVWTFTYDTRGNLHTTQYPNGTFSWQDLNAAGWLTGLYNRHGTLASPLPGVVPADSNAISDYTYTYNQDGRKKTETRTGGGITTETQSFTYDAAGRLSQATLPTGTVRDYLFDLDSNRTEIDETPSGGSKATIATYAYTPAAGLDQLASVTQGAQTTNYGYTTDGQVSSRGSDTLTWDGRGRLTGGTFSGTALSYGFDAAGRVRSRTAGGSTTTYLFSGGEGMFEKDYTTGTLQNTAVAGPAGDLAHYLGAPQTSTTTEFLYYTGHGDLAATADPAGLRTNATSYDPYGALQQTPPANSYLERWTGHWDKRLDTTDGLIQMGARPYDPTLGRFLAPDPVEGGSLNQYDYAGQDSVNGYDLNGEFFTNPDAGAPYCNTAACNAERRRLNAETARANARVDARRRQQQHRHHWWQTALQVVAWTATAFAVVASGGTLIGLLAVAFAANEAVILTSGANRRRILGATIFNILGTVLPFEERGALISQFAARRAFTFGFFNYASLRCQHEC